MTVITTLVKDTPVGVGLATEPEGLMQIREKSCAASIWQRDPLSSFQAWINAVDPEALPRARVVLRPEMVHDALTRIMDASDLPDCAERDMLVGDISAMASIFAQMMRAPYLRVRLDVITTNACRKFHIDAVTARLVCTYRGTGTQYGISADKSDPSHIFTVPTGSPIVLRGTLWPERPRSGLLHRSPPIEGTGEARLVLVLDPIFDTDDIEEHPVLH